MILFVENDPQCPTGLYGKLLTDWRIPHALWRSHFLEKPPSLCQVTGAVVLGGTMGVHDVPEYPYLAQVKNFLKEVVAKNLPCFGICLGGQLLAETLGGAVYENRNGEKGCHSSSLTKAGRTDPLFSDLPEHFPVFHWHNDSFDVPVGATHLAFSDRCPGQAFRFGNALGVQFHPEIDLTIATQWWNLSENNPEILADFRRQQSALQLAGAQLLKNFLSTTGALSKHFSETP